MRARKPAPQRLSGKRVFGAKPPNRLFRLPFVPAGGEGAGGKEGQTSAKQANEFTIQHSITLTANPPREVSLYFVIMSRPVSRMVLIT